MKQMTKRQINNQRKRIMDAARRDMEAIGTWKTEFEDALTLYADAKLQYTAAWDEYVAGGMSNTIECAGGSKKNPVLIVIEEARKSMTQLQDKLGLNPKALDSIKAAGETEFNAVANYLDTLEQTDG